MTYYADIGTMNQDTRKRIQETTEPPQLHDTRYKWVNLHDIERVMGSVGDDDITVQVGDKKPLTEMSFIAGMNLFHLHECRIPVTQHGNPVSVSIKKVAGIIKRCSMRPDVAFIDHISRKAYFCGS